MWWETTVHYKHDTASKLKPRVVLFVFSNITFLISLKNTTTNKDLLYFQLCFADNTGMQFPLNFFLFSNVHFLVQPKDETPH